MFGLFSDFKSKDEIDLIIAVKRLNAHHGVYSSLIGEWERIIINSTKFLMGEEDTHSLDDLKEYLSPETFENKEISRELKKILVYGVDEYSCEVQGKLTNVELMMGNKLIKRNIAEKELSISQEIFEQVDITEARVKEVRARINNYPKKVGMLTMKVGDGLLKRKRAMQILEVLEKMRHGKLIGARNKRDIMKFLLEQEWEALEVAKFHNVQSYKRALDSLPGRLVQFSKEMRDEIVGQLQSPDYDGLMSVLDFLAAFKERGPYWEEFKMRYDNLFKDEMDSLYDLLAKPMNLVGEALNRMVEIWVSPLKFTLGDEEEDLTGSPKKGGKTTLQIHNIEPSIIIDCLVNMIESVRGCMQSWNKLIRYLDTMIEYLSNMITDEKERVELCRDFQKALLVQKTNLIKQVYNILDKYLRLLVREAIVRTNPKCLFKLRLSFRRFVHDCEKFSDVIPENTLLETFENLINTYFEQVLAGHVDLTMAIIRSSDFELIQFDFAGFRKQIEEIFKTTNELSKESWNSLEKNQKVNKSTSEISARVPDSIPDLEKPMIQVDPVHKEEEEYVELKFEIINGQIIDQVNKLLLREKELKAMKMDNPCSVLASFFNAYTKLSLYFPEFHSKVAEKMNFLTRLFCFLILVKLIPSVSIQFMLGGQINLMSIDSEESFCQLENYHDIVLFQGKYNVLRRLMKTLNDQVNAVKVGNLRGKIVSTIVDLVAGSISKQDQKDKAGVQLQKVLKQIYSLSNLNQLNLFMKLDAEILEMQDVLFYNLLLNHSKESQVFAKTSKVRWDLLEEVSSLSEYVTDVNNSIKNLASLITKLGNRVSNCQVSSSATLRNKSTTCRSSLSGSTCTRLSTSMAPSRRFLLRLRTK